MTNAYDWLDDALDRLQADQLVRRRRCVVPLGDGWCEVDGRRLRSFASNDYLNLAGDPRVIAAARKALDECGVGARASALVVGRTQWHERLEQRLAEFENAPGIILFPTGYAANTGAIAALAGPGDVIYSDELNHASLIDGCRLSRAHVVIYPHCDARALDEQLAAEMPGQFRRRLIVSDSLFSMDGDACPLPQLSDLADRFDAMLLVDEAHATGVFGEHGRGLAERAGLEGRRMARVGTLSKAVGCLGGFVAGTKSLADLLWNRARPLVFSTALPPALCAAACASLDIIESEPWRREHLHALADRLRDGLAALGLAVPSGGIGPVVPVVLHEPSAVMEAAARLEERGILVAAIRPPSVPPATSRLRIALNVAHDQGDVDRLLAELAEITVVAPP